MNVIFLGTPSFAVKVLNALQNSKHKVIAVVCQPDSIGNRNKLLPCAVKQYALDCGLPVYDFKNISEQGVDILAALDADVMVTAAYGQMLSEQILNMTKYGVLNVHGSLLPMYRGASPVQRAVMDGLTETGVTIVKTVLKMDAGDIVSQAKAQILPTDTSDDMFDKLAQIGGELIVKALDDLQQNKATFTPQDCSKVTFCKKIKSDEEKIDWSMSAKKVCCQIMGLSSSPAAYTFFGGNRLKIFKARIYTSTQLQNNLASGQILYTKKQILVGCADGVIELLEIQPDKGKRMRTSDFLNGLKNYPTQMDIL